MVCLTVSSSDVVYRIWGVVLLWYVCVSTCVGSAALRNNDATMIQGLWYQIKGPLMNLSAF